MKKIFYTIALVAFAVAACSKQELLEDDAVIPQEQSQTRAGASMFQAGRVIVKFDDAMLALVEEDFTAGKVATKSMSLNNAMDNLGIVSYTRVFPDAGEFEERTRREGLHRYYMVSFDKQIKVTKAMDEFEAIPGVTMVEGVMKARRRAAVNDTHYGKQWHLYNKGGSSAFKFGADINVEGVWKNYTTGNPNVIVSVVDGGVALAHDDLADNAVPAGANGSKNFVKNNYNIEIDSHGTHVAGTIAAITNNGKGVAGVAGGDYANNVKGCKVMSCQIFNDDDYDDNNGSDDVCAAAIKWGADHGAVISQNSWGYYADTNDDGKVSTQEYNALKNTNVPKVIKDAINYFVKYAGCDNSGNQLPNSMMKGGVVFFAAGNEDIDIDPICTQCDVLAVGAFGPSGQKSSYSNWGDWVDIAAPGGDSDVNNSYSSTIYSIAPNNKYAYMEGTSMACPHVSGVAALIVSKYGGQGFTNTMLRNRLLRGAKEGYFSGSKNIGPKIDALASIELSADNHAPVITVDPSAVTQIKAWQTVDILLNVTDQDGDAVTVTSSNENGGESIKKADGAYYLTINAVAAGAGTYTTTLTATDVYDDFTTVEFTYTVLENNPPVANKGFANIISSAIGQIFSFNIDDYFTDADEEPLTYKFVMDDPKVAHCNVSNNTLYVTSLDYGLTSVAITATDALGKSVTSNFKMLVRDGDGTGVDAYPNPVVRTLYVRTGTEEVPTAVKVVSSTGSVVYDAVSTFSAFNPLQIDMSGCAPGVYNLSVTLNGTTHTKTIVKR